MPQLRPYQIAATEGVKAAIRGGARRVLLVMPTGAGKTVTFSQWLASATAKGSSALLVAHRRELISQGSKHLTYNSVPHGIILGGVRRDFSKRVHVCSVQSLVPVLYPSHPEAAPEPPRADIIVLDECHRASAASYKKILEKYPSAIILGVTATPERTDGRGLGDVFESMVEVIDTAELIEMGYLCDYRIYEGQYEAPDADLKMIGDDFDDGEAEKRLDTDKLVGEVYDNWKRIADGKRTVVFAQTRKHGRHIASVFESAGESVAYLDGATKSSDRDRIITEFGEGKITTIVNVNILVEGFDVPGIECVVLAFMTASIIKYRQAIGRALRPAEGKPYAIILDHGGNARHRFGPPDAPHQWSLDGRKKREQPVQPSLSECPACRAIVTARTRICPDCGYEFAARPQTKHKDATIPGMLVEANYKIRGSEREEKRRAALTEKQLRAEEREKKRIAKEQAEAAKLKRLEDEKNFLREAVARAASKGYNFKHPLMKFKERFGKFPGGKHGVSIKYERRWVSELGDFKYGVVAFEYEGVTYGAQTAE